MKAVVYHADSHFVSGGKVGDIYKRLFQKFVPMCHDFGMEVIHLTAQGHEGWGDENYFYDLNPREVVANRERAFVSFLSDAPEDVYWFGEPDFVIHKMWPPLETDCAMLYRRNDGVAMTPAWRMATPKALPFFVECRDEMKKMSRKDWHGDSEAFVNVWKRMGSPGLGRHVYRGLSFEFRKYAEYIKPKGTYSRNYLDEHNKKTLLETD